MAIVPIGSNISGIKPLTGELLKSGQSSENTTEGFKSVLQNMIDNVEQTEAVTREDAYMLSIGEVDDLHTMMINAAKADLALQTMVQLRNKMLDAYSEIMRINL
ncbi:MAG: flagellar hook-basal body complex protein FliE [Anaerovoracaceae bacterium]|jgi:flagellar hook-basal body complex protein FliE